jgi:hypothetical protein
MPWVSRSEYHYLCARAEKADLYFDRMVKITEAHDARRQQVRHLRKTIHRLRSDVGAAVNIAVREAHVLPSSAGEPKS